MAKSRPSLEAGDAPGANDVGDPNRIWVSAAKVINLGNYESFRVEFGSGRAVAPDQDRDEARQNLTVEVFGGLRELIDLVQSSLKQ